MEIRTVKENVSSAWKEKFRNMTKRKKTYLSGKNLYSLEEAKNILPSSNPSLSYSFARQLSSLLLQQLFETEKYGGELNNVCVCVV